MPDNRTSPEDTDLYRSFDTFTDAEKQHLTGQLTGEAFLDTIAKGPPSNDREAMIYGLLRVHGVDNVAAATELGLGPAYLRRRLPYLEAPWKQRVHAKLLAMNEVEEELPPTTSVLATTDRSSSHAPAATYAAAAAYERDPKRSRLHQNSRERSRERSPAGRSFSGPADASGSSSGRIIYPIPSDRYKDTPFWQGAGEAAKMPDDMVDWAKASQRPPTGCCKDESEIRAIPQGTRRCYVRGCDLEHTWRKCAKFANHFALLKYQKKVPAPITTPLTVRA
ncbi:hypothetical protein WJX72_009777 [[Myrmecia] bisecta]|uniref:Uncharacterized protein n=1 Tax=[Myrmecia] bisecta TaxID=41462 RepID=A0AAW1R7X2_9CHLO